MSEKRLKELLAKLMRAQDDVTHYNEAGPDYAHETDRLILERSDIRDAVISEFVTLRQQRDELLALCEDAYNVLVANRWKGRGTKSGQNLLCGLRGKIAALTDKSLREVQEAAEERAARAALARIKEPK